MAYPWMRGSITALVTPFQGGRVDFDAIPRLVARQIEGGTSAIVAVGTTGEASTLKEAEHVDVVRAMVEAANGAIPIIAGIGSNNTATSIAIAADVAEVGAQAVLSVAGYYNRPSQDGLIAHFQAVAEAVDLPVIVYNIPGRTACGIDEDTLVTISRFPGIVGVKDSTGDLSRVASQRLACGRDFIQLSGEDATAVGFNAMGGVGCISVTSNVVPDLCSALQLACRMGKWDEALELQDKLTPLHQALFSDRSPGPVKYALSRLGLMDESLRLPMVPASTTAKARVDRALTGLGLL